MFGRSLFQMMGPKVKACNSLIPLADSTYKTELKKISALIYSNLAIKKTQIFLTGDFAAFGFCCLLLGFSGLRRYSDTHRKIHEF